LASLPPQGPALADYLVVSDPPPPRPPRLGVFLERASGGLLVKMVRPASPAAKAGMQSGDFLTKVDGKAVKEVKDIHNVLKLTPYETHVYTVSRMGRVIKLNITLLPDS
jgi:S1-C subfamily serine protease